MAIAKMSKFNLLMPALYREELFRELQVFRNVEFHESRIDDSKALELLTPVSKNESIEKLEDEISRCNYVIDLVSKYAPKKGGFKAMAEGLPNLTFEELELIEKTFDFDGYYKKIRELGDELDSIEYRLAKFGESIEDLSPFYKFDATQKQLDRLERTFDAIGGVPVKMATAFEARMSEINLVYVEPMGIRKEEKVYMVIVHGEVDVDIEEEFRLLSFTRTKLNLVKPPAEKIEELRREKDELRARREQVVQEIKTFAPELSKVKEIYEYKENIKLRLKEEEKLLETEKVSMIDGYVLTEEEQKFIQLVEKTTKGICSLNVEVAEKDSEEVPIMLKNNRLIRAFESLTSTYALPKYNEIDPTPLFAFVYALFFGMMAADAAYGLILLIVTTVSLKKFNLAPNTKHMVKFFRIISLSTITWGVLYGSYFGAAIPGMWRWLDPSKDFMTILIFSIGIGIVHIYYGLGIKAYMDFRDGKPLDAVFNAFSWYIALSGGLVYLIAYFMKITGSIPNIALYVMLAGFIMILIGGMMSAEGNIGAKLGAGLYNLYGISGYVGDFVSYSRLMALGLSGGFIAFAINVIAGLLFKSPIGIPIAIVVLVVFHAFNLFLSFLGAYVHALRLIYVEFFGKFYEGGGRAFKFFRSKSKYINLDRRYED